MSGKWATVGFWSGGEVAFEGEALLALLQDPRATLYIVQDPARARLGVAQGGAMGAEGWPVVGVLPPLYPEWLGDRSFCEVHRLRFPLVSGAMANGIATTRLVRAMAEAGMMGFFGAAGLGLDRIEAAVDELLGALGEDGPSWGVNLIHSPQEPALEAAAADLLLRRGVHRVEASAFMGLTLPLVRYAASGLWVDPQGRLRRRNHVVAKVSRPEVARRFLSPAPKEMLQALVSQGLLTQAEADLAARVPVAEDITVESDSGGHTDNRPLVALFPVILAQRDELVARFGYERPVRVGAAGGLGTPASVAAAFGLGAAYVMTGSVNQAAVESGLSEAGRLMLAQAGIADVDMAAAADMFELGVKVQVLKRGTMFAARANRLYEVYNRYDGLDAIPADERARLEREVLGASVEEVRAETRAFWAQRHAPENEKAARDPKHEMALCFRWYLGLSSRWAIRGEASRRLDYQIWCGPAMGAFNDWAKGSFLEDPSQRSAPVISRNLLEGAAVVTRAQQARSYGVAVPSSAFRFHPRPLT